MSDDKKTSPSGEGERKPLFTGDFRRDTVVSEFEKAAEISYAIREAISRLQAKQKKE